jgi:hypothetical protein
MDREDDHGKEVEDEEEICKEGRSGAQKKENDEIGGEEGPEEDRKEEGVEGREKGGPQAQGAGEETGTNARGGTGPGSVLAIAPGLAFQRRRLRKRYYLSGSCPTGRSRDRARHSAHAFERLRVSAVARILYRVRVYRGVWPRAAVHFYSLFPLDAALRRLGGAHI